MRVVSLSSDDATFAVRHALVIDGGELFKSQRSRTLAEKYGVSLAQLCIRCTLQQGIGDASMFPVYSGA